MNCLHPINLRKLGIIVPCGKCIKCRIQRTNEWKLRLVHESRYHEESCFITLTYNDENLPEDRSLDKRVLQNFIKRLRKRIEPVRIKYYASGEYGSLLLREHYHIICFGWNPPIEDLYKAYKKKGKQYYGSRTISALWTYGFNVVGQVTGDSCQYVAGYVRKKLFGKQGHNIYGGRLPPFALQSRGIGARYAFEHWEELKTNLCVIERGKNLGTPRYYAKVVNLDTQDLQMKRHKIEAEVFQKYVDEGYDWSNYQDLKKESIEQEEKDMLYLENMRR